MTTVKLRYHLSVNGRHISDHNELRCAIAARKRMTGARIAASVVGRPWSRQWDIDRESKRHPPPESVRAAILADKRKEGLC